MADDRSDGFPYGGFAFVMATGIVSIAASLNDLPRVPAILFGLNLVAYAVLLALLLAHLARQPRSILADLSDHRRGPGVLATVAATCVLGNQIVLMTSHPDVAAAFWCGAALLWLGLVYGFFALLTVSPAKPPIAAGIDGSWLLAVVATEALAILTASAADAILPGEASLLAALCLFLLGGTFYLMLLILIVYRWLFLPMRPEQLAPSYWINMGAAAIATLAGARLLAMLDLAPPTMPVRGFVVGATLLFWSLATWWIPLLAVLSVWRHCDVRLRYRIEHWSVVFPLGMYTTATWRLAEQLRLPSLALVPHVFVWIALTAWCLAFAGMVREVMPMLIRPSA